MARTPALDPGDAYEYSVSTLVRPKAGVEMWIKVDVVGQVREDESGARAAARIERFVEDRLNRKVQEALGQ